MDLKVPWEVELVQKRKYKQRARSKAKFDKVKGRKRGKPNRANREAGDVGETLSMDKNGFDGLTKPDFHASSGAANKKRGWVIAATEEPKAKVKKAFAPPKLPKPGGMLKPVTQPKPATGAKAPGAPAGAKPATAPKAPTPVQTLRPPSMLPPKPGMKPVQPQRPR